MAAFATKRIQKELSKIHDNTPPGIKFINADNLFQWNMEIRVLDENPLYANKKFRLQFRFGSNYPIEPPEVVFLPSPNQRYSFGSGMPKWPVSPNAPPPSYSSATSSTYSNNRIDVKDLLTSSPAKTTVEAPTQETWDGVPIHPHIYSNGIICLDLLDKSAWSPVHNVESVCISLQSMLTSNTKNERPPNDDEFCRTNSLRPKDIRFLFHDDGV